MKTFYLSRTTLAQIEELARQGFPYEICGFIAGPQIGQGHEIQPTHNLSPYPQVEYNIAPEETLTTLLKLESRGLKLTGVYHSHPRYPAQPSGTDLNLADLPDACYLITSVQEKSNKTLSCETRAWSIERRKPQAVKLVIID